MNTTTTATSLRRPLSTTEHSKTTPSPTTTKSTTEAVKTTTTTTKANGGGGLIQWYEGHLNAHPILTKMVTGCFLWGLGDAVAQIVPQHFAAVPDDHKKTDYDYARTGRAVLFGFALHAPTSHAHFNFLEWMTVKCQLTGFARPIFKAFMEQFVYWSWISNSMYHGFMGAMQGMNASQVYDYIASVLWDTQKAQWAFWIPVQLLNFQYIPVRHQLNVVLCTSVVWTALLSAWYPPQKDDNDQTKELASKEK